MRQVNIRTLRSELSTQLEDLPFEITKNGKTLAIVCTHSTNPLKEGKLQALDSIDISEEYTQQKATIPMEEIPWVNPLAGSALAPKK